MGQVVGAKLTQLAKMIMISALVCSSQPMMLASPGAQSSMRPAMRAPSSLPATDRRVIVQANHGPKKAEAVVGEIVAAGGNVEAVVFDVTESEPTATGLADLGRDILAAAASRSRRRGVGVVYWHDPGCGGVWVSEEVGMAMRVKPETGEVGLKQRYRVTNWSEYDRALVNRGNLTIWFDEASIRDSWTPPRPIGRGKPGWYSETAIQTCLTIKTLFQLPYRATEGLIKSLMRLCHLDLPVPDHTHMSRRAGELSVKIPRRPRRGRHTWWSIRPAEDLRRRRMEGASARGGQAPHLAQDPSGRRRNHQGHHRH
jgi:hypothetical protein